MATTALRSAKIACSMSRICRTVAPRLCVASTINQNIQNKYHTCQRSRKSALLKQSIMGTHEPQCLYSSEVPNKEIQDKVLKCLASFDKISAEKLTLESHFMNDLGLDSLDQVEIIMKMEDEFGFEIPDMDAERLMTPADIAQYVCDKHDIYDD